MNQKTLIFSGNPKAASTWIGGLIAGISIEMGKSIFYGQYAIPENLNHLQKENYDVIISQSSNYGQLLSLGVNFKAVHVIRDPRDVCVSSYFSFKKTHEIGHWKALGELRAKLNKTSREEGMMEVLLFNKYFFDQLLLWNYDDERILELKYEEIIECPAASILEICQFFGFHTGLKKSSYFTLIGYYNRLLYKNKVLYKFFKFTQRKIPQERVLKINKKLSFSSLSKGRSRGQENVSSHYRKGQSNDWKNYFTDSLKLEFKKQYGHLLIKLGYEKDHNW